MLLNNTNLYKKIIEKISVLYQLQRIDTETKNKLTDLAYKGFEKKDYKELYDFTIQQNDKNLYPIQELLLEKTF